MKPVAQQIDLVEGEPLYIKADSLDEQVAKALYRSQHFDFQFPSFANDFHYIITARNIVGHVTIGRDCLVRVAPKTPVSNLFRMLEVAYDLRSFRLLDGVTHVEAVADLYERLASILAKRILGRVRKGLYRGYVDQHDDLPYVRGRLAPARTAIMLAQGNVAVHCEYQEHTADLEDNRILLWTLRVIGGLRLFRPEVRLEVQRAYRALLHSVALVSIAASTCRGRRYHRLNQDYEAMHGICRFFLEHQGPGVRHGRSDMMPFVVNMPRLFETFVANWMISNMPRQYQVRAQHVARLRSTEPVEFRIDIVVRDAQSGRAIAVLDTKYKIGAAVREEDIQQVVAYAVEMGVEKAFLVFPTNAVKKTEIQVGPVRVETICFDVGHDYEAAGEQYRSALLSRLLK